MQLGPKDYDSDFSLIYEIIPCTINRALFLIESFSYNAYRMQIFLEKTNTIQEAITNPSLHFRLRLAAVARLLCFSKFCVPGLMYFQVTKPSRRRQKAFRYQE